MEKLLYYNQVIQAGIHLDFMRFLYNSTDWNQRMIAISGARGSGKTTLLLQRQKIATHLGKDSLYVSMEHPYFYTNSLYDLADEIYKTGIKYLFIDEVHKYSNWSRELKVIYDMFPDMNVAFTASSALEIFRGEADLSRRVISYQLPGMSFREYLEMKKIFKSPTYSLEDILENHVEISMIFISQKEINILPLFHEYLKNGYFPFGVELSSDDYVVRMNQVINTILDTDLAYTNGYTPFTALKLKKLLAVLSESVPFQPNVAELARKLEISRDSIYHYMKFLEKASLISMLYADGKGVSLLQKPEKLYLENTNLAYALTLQPEKGNLRETFLFSQLKNLGKEVTYPKQGDFKVGKYTFEVGGKQKKKKQIADIPDSYIISDDILTGFGNKIPLWMMGLMY